jgi:hypothetical protein
MRSASLFDCFDRHLSNVEILNETDELFVVKVIEDYILNLSGLGYTMGVHAEEIYIELQEEVQNMLKTKIYGYYNIDEYRAVLRKNTVPAA